MWVMELNLFKKSVLKHFLNFFVLLNSISCRGRTNLFQRE